MSWSINAVGIRANVKAQVNADTHIPQKVKEAICETIDAGDPVMHANGNPILDGVRVAGHGHLGKQHPWSRIGKLEVEPVHLAPDPVQTAV